MDRRMYHSNMGRSRYVPPYRATQPVCGDIPDSDCGCERSRSYCEDDFKPERFPIGMCYVPWQCFRDLYENEFAALENGTLFKELQYDWYGRGC
jgi:hypothetical protein